MSRRIRAALLLTALGLPALGAHADPASGFDFLLDEPAARAAALAGAVAADGASLDSLRYNPAGLAGLAGLQAAVADDSAAGDWTEAWAAVAAPLGPTVLGGEALVSNVAPFTLYDGNGQPDGTATAGNQNLGLGAALPLGAWLRLGADIRYFRSQLYTYVSQGGALDVGGQVGRAGSPVSAGLAVQNLGLASAYISQSDPLPLLLRVGLRGAFSPERGLDLDTEADLVGYADASRPTELRLGVEARMRTSLYLRAGWNQSSASGGPSLGLGATWKSFELDYAYETGGLLGSDEMVELKVAEP